LTLADSIICLLAELKSQIASSVLLTPSDEANLAPNKGKLADKPATPVFHEDTPMSNFPTVSRYWHSKVYILQSASLGNLPVNSDGPTINGTSWNVVWHLCHINYEIADLTIEIVLICPPEFIN
jgi:hypothetical protein